MLHKNNSEITKCRDKPCTDADRFVCCDYRQTCELFACEGDYEDSDMKHESYCEGRACLPYVDVNNCCQLKAVVNETVNETMPEEKSQPEAQNDQAAPSPTEAPGISTRHQSKDLGAATTTTNLGERLENFAHRAAHLPLLAALLLVAGISSS
jgi:hypothetical protein